jgi:hypothetical protein
MGDQAEVFLVSEKPVRRGLIGKEIERTDG